MLTFRSLTLIFAVAGVAFILRGGIPRNRTSDQHEAALMADWSDPPPWPVCVLTASRGCQVAIHGILSLYSSMSWQDPCAAWQIPSHLRPFAQWNLDLPTKPPSCCIFANPSKLLTFWRRVPRRSQRLLPIETADVMRVERTMYAMAADGITQLQQPGWSNDKEPRFVNSALSAVLRSDYPNSFRGMVGHQIQDGYEAFAKIPRMLGPNPIDIPWDHVPDFVNYQGGQIWKYYDDHPEREEQFGRAMSALEGLGGKAMAADVPFGRFNRVIDMGGSLGHFLYKILQNNPSQQGMLFDRPHVIPNAQKLWNEKGGMYHDGTQDRLSMVAGNFFELEALPNLKNGDVVVLRYILHDWPKVECLKILGNLRIKMRDSDATLMIGESAVADRGSISVPSIITKIDLWMMNLFGTAIERTPAMWKELLEEAGFDLVTFHPTRSAIHFVEAVPKK